MAAFRALSPTGAEPGRGFRALYQRLGDLRLGEPPPALVFADVDGFGEVAESLGPGRTSEVLEEIAGRLSAVVRGRDLFAHLGWDGYCVLLAGPTHPEVAEEVARRMLAAG